MLNQLRHARDIISMEAVAGGNAAAAAVSRLPSFFDKASEFLTKTVLQSLGDFFSVKNLGWLALNASRANYSELRGLQVVAPPGFKGTLAEYGNTLIKGAEEMDDLYKDVLEPFNAWLGQRVADPESLKNLTNTLRIPGLTQPKIEGIQKQLDRYFPDKAEDKPAVYGELFKRQADWVDLNNQVKKLNTLYANGNFERVQKKIPELSELLRLLSARMAEDKSAEVYQFSSVTIDKLSQVIFDVAEHVEFYGVLRHRVDEFVRIVDQNVELVKPSI